MAKIWTRPPPACRKRSTFRHAHRQSPTSIRSSGDPTFRDVITTALGIPKEIAFQEITAQERAISNRIDLKQFKDAKFVAQFTQRYLIAAQQATSFATGVPDLSTLAGQSAGLLV